MSDLERPHEPAPSARAGAGRGDAVADRLERMPYGRFHRNFLLMVTAGEFVESFMLLGTVCCSR